MGQRPVATMDALRDIDENTQPADFPFRLLAILRYTARFPIFPMKLKSLLSLILLLLGPLVFSGCVDTLSQQQDTQRAALNDAIKNEAPGDYYIGRRYYKVDYKFWGFVRRPQQPWSTAKLVMMNEQQKLAPDRQLGVLGSDHGYEYKLYGHFSGDTVYEPASNSFYPEFVLTGYDLISTTPPPILYIPGSNDPARRIIETPH
jgi:hypothetical protein